MRIAFKPTIQTDKTFLKETIDDFDLIDRIFNFKQKHLNYYDIFDIQTYTDNSRYLLNLYKLQVVQKIVDKTAYNTMINQTQLLQVIELDMHFDFDFNFELLSSKYINLWNNNINIDYIKPFCYSADNRNNIGFYVFNSIITDLFTRIFNMISAKNIICFKYNNKLVLIYPIIDQKTNNHLDDILDDFLNIVYELVKIAQAFINFSIPPEQGLKEINMQDWYSYIRSKNKKRRK